MAPHPEYIPASPASEGDATHLLREALRLPAQNRIVAEWIFDEQEQDFHVNSNTVPPRAFDNALVLVSKSKFIPGNDTPLPTSCFQQITNGSANDFTTLFMLHLLVKESDGFYMGYSFTIGSPFEETLLPLRDAFGTYSIVGRFVLDNDRRHMLVYISNFTSSTSLVMSLNWHENNHRSRSYFSIPNEEYGYHKLPTEVTGFTINDEYMVPGPPNAPAPTTAPRPRKPPHPPPEKEKRPFEYPHAIVTKSGSMHPTGLPWVENVAELDPNLLDIFTPENVEAMSTPGNVFGFGRPQETSTSISFTREFHSKERLPYHMNGFANASISRSIDNGSCPDFVSGMWGVFQGSFFSPAVIRQIRTGGECNSPSVVGQIRVQIGTAPQEDRMVLQSFARRRYYAETQPVSPDEYFLTSDREESQNGHTNGIA